MMIVVMAVVLMLIMTHGDYDDEDATMMMTDDHTEDSRDAGWQGLLPYFTLKAHVAVHNPSIATPKSYLDQRIESGN